jgi:hypothetical protein
MTKILNIATGSNGGRLPCGPSEWQSAAISRPKGIELIAKVTQTLELFINKNAGCPRIESSSPPFPWMESETPRVGEVLRTSRWLLKKHSKPMTPHKSRSIGTQELTYSPSEGQLTYSPSEGQSLRRRRKRATGLALQKWGAIPYEGKRRWL